MKKPKIICFGEILWDLLPTGKIAGGAPMNVAYHLNNFGIASSMISRVGNDDLGKELSQLLENKGVDTSLVQKDTFYPTGTVKVSLDENGSPSYEIIKPVAWDFINQNIGNFKAVKESNGLVFGSLSARSNRTKETLFNLVEAAKLRVFDVNLRPPFFEKELVETLLHKAHIVKMNEEELHLIGQWQFEDKSDFILAQRLKTHFNINILIVTRGENGAFVIDKADKIKAIAAKKVMVKDTIGSGDAFLAGFLSQYLNGKPLFYCLDFGARAGALVATKSGGTPKINEAMVLDL